MDIVVDIDVLLKLGLVCSITTSNVSNAYSSIATVIHDIKQPGLKILAVCKRGSSKTQRSD